MNHSAHHSTQPELQEERLEALPKGHSFPLGRTIWATLACVGLALPGAGYGAEANLTKRSGDAQALVDQEAERHVERLIQAEGVRLERERAAFPGYFAEAYAQYPRLPEGILEAMAFVGSRWIHRIPAGLQDGHHNMPQAFGVMGLYRGVGGFRDVVSEAAAALKVSPAEVIASPRTQILATAALLDQLIRESGLGAGKTSPFVEELVPVLHRISGLPERGSVARFALDSYAYDVLLTLDRGHDDWGIRIQDREIFWEQAFSKETLKLMKAPMVRVAVENDSVEALDKIVAAESHVKGQEARGTSAPGEAQSGAKETASTPQSTDYAPALWVSSPNYSSRNGTAITHVAIHTVQGSYSGCISWFQNPDSDVSAHYVARSSDGQITQMVREYNKAWHIGSENPYTLGTEHEGYVSTSSYYTTAMYNSSGALTKDMCASNKIDCSTCYSGTSQGELSNSYKVKGHQHYANQTHTDPGQYWSWSKYKSLVTGSSSGGSSGGSDGGSTSSSKVLDSFESSEGHFNTSPTYSGSTTGISSSSTAERTSSTKKNGSYSERLYLVDNASSSGSWTVRFLSGSGSASNNTKVDKAGGRLGFWVYSGGSGFSAALTVDDGSGTELSVKKSIPTTTWTYLEWKLDDAAQWENFSGGNGTIDSSQVTLDAIMFYHANSSYSSYIYIDDVTYKK